jgi:transglutaminase-like putative cysteine protease
MTTLEVVHETRYDYAAPVTPALHMAHLEPSNDEAQALLDFTLHVDPAPDELVSEVDVFGNACCRFGVITAHRELTVRSTSRVRLTPRFESLDAARSPAWETVRERLRYVARAPFEPAVEFVQPSPFVPRLDPLAAYAATSVTPGRPLAEAAIELMHRVHADFRYEGGSTHIDTPLAEAFERRCGVCQDFAHVMIGALRMHRLPARYVSGYLLTHPPEGGPDMIGADASHAWVQVWAPGTPGVPADGWLDLDPTNDVIPGTGHVRVAVGRDFGDVTPLRGVIRGGGEHTLHVAVRTRVLAAAD